MEDVLDVYQRPLDEARPLVCLDEASKQLLSDARPALPLEPGCPIRQDSEYVRNGTVSLFMVSAPLLGFRHVEVTDQRTRKDFAQVIKTLVDEQFAQAQKIVLVMDNLNTHGPASLYEAFEPAEAKRLSDKLEIHYTPKHGSWLNMAEIELSVLARQCLSERMDDKANLQKQVAAWQERRNASSVKIDWRFTTDDARIKLKRLYPTILP
jgi:transposase